MTIDLRPAAIALALAISACGGGGDDGDGVATLTGSDGAGGDTTTTTVDPEEGMLRFTRCMREHGVEMPDPGGDGALLIDPDSGIDPSDPTFRAAEEACAEHLPQAGAVQSDQDLAELQDQLRAMAECMRDRGFDVPDPEIRKVGDGGPPPDPSGSPGFDPDDPAFRAAERECSDGAGRPTPGGRP